MCSDLFHTGRMVTGNWLYSATDTAEMLYEKELTYWGKINKNGKGLPAEIKTVKEQENELSTYFWKIESPAMLVLHVLKSGKNVLLISIGDEGHDIRPDLHKKIKQSWFVQLKTM